jgi:hypothetical protein
VRLAWPKRPKIVYSPSYVDIRSRACHIILTSLKLKHYLKVWTILIHLSVAEIMRGYSCPKETCMLTSSYCNWMTPDLNFHLLTPFDFLHTESFTIIQLRKKNGLFFLLKNKSKFLQKRRWQFFVIKIMFYVFIFVLV